MAKRGIKKKIEWHKELSLKNRKKNLEEAKKVKTQPKESIESLLTEKSMLEKRRMSNYRFFLYFGGILKLIPLPAVDDGGRILDEGICLFCKHKICNKICRFWKVCSICGRQKHIFLFTQDSVSRSSGSGVCRECRRKIHRHFNLDIPGVKVSGKNKYFLGE